MHDTVTKTYRHLNFFQQECELEVRVPRVKLPEGKVMQIIPPWSGKLSGFTLLFEAFVLLLAPETTFSGAARIGGLSVHRVMALDHHAHSTRLAIPGAAARDPHPQAADPRAPAAQSLVQQRAALEGRAHEGSRRNVRGHLEGIRAWATSKQTNGFLGAINGLFQAAKRKAHGYGRFRTIRMVIFMIAGKLDFSRINPHVMA